jgi:hypothetical protein
MNSGGGRLQKCNRGEFWAFRPRKVIYCEVSYTEIDHQQSIKARLAPGARTSGLKHSLFALGLKVSIGRPLRSGYRVGGYLMKKPTGNEILMKAMQLAQEDGKPWLWSSNELDNERDERGPFIYDSLRTEYLKRALELLRREESSPQEGA